MVVKEKAGEEWLCPSASGGTESSCRSENRSFSGKYFKCQGANIVRDYKADVTCYRWGKWGHVAHYCDQGNEGGRVTTAPVAAPTIQ